MWSSVVCELECKVTVVCRVCEVCVWFMWLFRVSVVSTGEPLSSCLRINCVFFKWPLVLLFLPLDCNMRCKYSLALAISSLSVWKPPCEAVCQDYCNHNLQTFVMALFLALTEITKSSDTFTVFSLSPWNQKDTFCTTRLSSADECYRPMLLRGTGSNKSDLDEFHGSGFQR